MEYCTICLSNRRKMFTHTCGETCCHACASTYVQHTCGTASRAAPDRDNDATVEYASEDTVARCMFCREELDYMEIAEFMPVSKYVQLRAQNVADGYASMFTNVYPDLVRAYRQKSMDLHHFPEFAAAYRRLNEAFVVSMAAISSRTDPVTTSLREEFEAQRAAYDRITAGVGFNKYPGPIEAVVDGSGPGMLRPQLCTCSGVLDFTLEHPACSACGKITCMTCRESVTADEYATHVCDKNTMETVKEIEAVCKQCPLCKAFIQKAEGCNDMFCTVCHTSFNWRTLEISKRETHNPHRAAYLDETRRANITANDLCGRDMVTHMDLQAVRSLLPTEDMRLLTAIRALATSIESYILRKHSFAIKANSDRHRERLRFLYASEQMNDIKFGRQLHLLKSKVQADIAAFTQYFFLRQVMEHLLLSYFEDPNRNIEAIRTGCSEALDWFKDNCNRQGIKTSTLTHLTELRYRLAQAQAPARAPAPAAPWP